MDSRTLKLLGDERLKKLKDSHVVICGLGGVGSYAAEALSRASIGKITLVDSDKVDRSNINRQLFALHSTIDRYKADVAAERIRDINPDCEIDVKKIFIDGNNIPDILRDDICCVVDAIDSVSSKIELLLTAFNRNIFTVSSMGAAEKTDSEKIFMKDISKTHSCGLAKVVRTRLRKSGIKRGIPCVFSTEIREKRENHEERSHLGSISYIPSIFGLKLAGAVINKLTE